MNSPNLTETLANLSVDVIVGFVVLATILRISLLKIQNTTTRSAAEILESGLIAVVLVFLVIRPFVLQAYFIPSPSMEPTLLGKNGNGDRILVNKLIYRKQAPQHDDVVVFIPPPAATDNTSEESGGSPVNFIKRLIGKPGDVIEAHAGKVIIGDTVFDHQRLEKILTDAGVIQPDDFAASDSEVKPDHRIKLVDGAILVDDKSYAPTELAKIIHIDGSTKITIVPGYTTINGKKLDEPFTAEDPDYDLQLFHGKPLKRLGPSYDEATRYRLDHTPISMQEYEADAKSAPEAVPKDTFFMMGDNRNNSTDSTEWGPLEKSRVVGRAEFVFWPLGRMGRIPTK